jgi:hypothetical protein
MLQRRHPQPVDHGRRFGWIVHRNQGVVITPMPLGEGGGSDVRLEWSDVPRTDAEEVGHKKESMFGCL